MGAALYISICGGDDEKKCHGEAQNIKKKRKTDWRKQIGKLTEKAHTVAHDVLAPFFYWVLPDQIQ